jgi:hypothetical protein
MKNSLLVASLLAVALAACSKQEPPKPAEPPKVEAPKPAAEAPKPADAQAGMAGMSGMAGQQGHGWHVRHGWPARHGWHVRYGRCSCCGSGCRCSGCRRRSGRPRRRACRSCEEVIFLRPQGKKASLRAGFFISRASQTPHPGTQLRSIPARSPALQTTPSTQAQAYCSVPRCARQRHVASVTGRFSPAETPAAALSRWPSDPAIRRFK